MFKLNPVHDEVVVGWKPNVETQGKDDENDKGSRE